MVTDRIFTVRFLIELLVVGFLTVVFGYVAGFLVKMIHNVEIPEVCKAFNENYVMEKTLFLTGVLLYLVLELAGVNNWQCKRLHEMRMGMRMGMAEAA
jgi:hypothetical protein